LFLFSIVEDLVFYIDSEFDITQNENCYKISLLGLNWRVRFFDLIIIKDNWKMEEQLGQT
jgi:hypothetical protein